MRQAHPKHCHATIPAGLFAEEKTVMKCVGSTLDIRQQRDKYNSPKRNLHAALAPGMLRRRRLAHHVLVCYLSDWAPYGER